MATPGTPERPVRVAVVGAGPAGFFTAAALLKSTSPVFEVDVFERLPTPFGLVRSGVAPDHQKIKSVSRTFEKTAKHGRFRFLNTPRGQQVRAGLFVSPIGLHGNNRRLLNGSIDWEIRSARRTTDLLAGSPILRKVTGSLWIQLRQTRTRTVGHYGPVTLVVVLDFIHQAIGVIPQFNAFAAVG